jgi:hypothetical protein
MIRAQAGRMQDLRRALSRLAAALLGVLVFLSCGAPAVAAPLSAGVDHASAIGLSANYLQEEGGRLDLAGALAAYRAGRFSRGESPVLNFGIGARPVWIHFAVDNQTSTALPKRLSIETPWLDEVEVHFQHGGRTAAKYRVGDTLPFAQRPIASRYFIFEHAFGEGVTDVFVRVATPDPMVVPIHLLDPETSRLRQTRQELTYGFVYGFLFALMAFNAVLYFSLRSRRYLFYAIYLGMFVAMNIAYTGPIRLPGSNGPIRS